MSELLKLYRDAQNRGCGVKRPTITELAAKYKALGYDRFYAWGRYVADTGLKPEVDAKEFYRIYANTAARKVEHELPAGWTRTHIDTLCGRGVQIKHENGVYYMVWDNGITGSDPDAFHPADRYLELNE